MSTGGAQDEPRSTLPLKRFRRSPGGIQEEASRSPGGAEEEPRRSRGVAQQEKDEEEDDEDLPFPPSQVRANS